MNDPKDLSESVIFPKGGEAPNDHFIGQAWMEMLVPDGDENYDFSIGNVTFAPGARNSWHTHERGQILMVTGGEGYVREEGKPAQLIKAGETIKIKPHVKHWHGATADSWMVHIALNLGAPQWLEPVSDEEYNRLK